METFPQTISGFFSRISTLFTSFLLPYIPQGTKQLAIVFLVLAILIGAISYFVIKKSNSQIQQEQVTKFDPLFSSLSQTRKGVNAYLDEKIVQESKKNWCLFNFAPLTLLNAGYGERTPEGGLYNINEISRALDLGFRCFSFNIDFYTGSEKPSSNPEKPIPPGYPCLLDRDDQGVVRSINCGSISDMMTALSQQAFSQSLPTGQDPLIVFLDFKNVPDSVKNKDTFVKFLRNVSLEIQALRPSFLARLGDTRFSNLQDPALLFAQNFQALRGKTIILTNVNTDYFTTSEASSIPIEENLRSMINAQMYSLSSDPLPNDPVTQIVPKGSILSVGRQFARYFLQSPPEKLSEMQLKTNNVFTFVNPSDTTSNHSQKTIETLFNQFGAQMIPFNIYIDPKQTDEFFKVWGPYSWKLKPAQLQYQIVREKPPQPISTRANANGGNVSPPALAI